MTRITNYSPGVAARQGQHPKYFLPKGKTILGADRLTRPLQVILDSGTMTLKRQSGQMLVALLAFMATAITLTTMATIVTLTNAQATSKYSSGQEALAVAESGIENALARMLRDPNYTGETMTVGTSTATISISGSFPKTIVSVGRSGDFRRTITVTATQSAATLNILSWSETP